MNPDWFVISAVLLSSVSTTAYLLTLYRRKAERNIYLWKYFDAAWMVGIFLYFLYGHIPLADRQQITQIAIVVCYLIRTFVYTALAYINYKNKNE